MSHRNYPYSSTYRNPWAEPYKSRPAEWELRILAGEMAEAKAHLQAWARRTVSARKELGSR